MLPLFEEKNLQITTALPETQDSALSRCHYNYQDDTKPRKVTHLN